MSNSFLATYILNLSAESTTKIIAYSK